MDLRNSEKLHLVLAELIGVERTKYDRIFDILYGDFEYCYKENDVVLEHILGKEQFKRIEGKLTNDYADQLLENLAKNKIEITTKSSKNYPKKLLELPDAPNVILYKGNLSLIDEMTVGIVGSRRTLPLNLNLAERIAEELTLNQINVVSGIADGADERAIIGAMKNNRAISVLASGHNKIYPSRNKALVEKLAENGLVISEYLPNVSTQKFFYPRRNAVIAGIADGLLVVSGTKTSGTRHTAKSAKEYGKKLFALPYNVGIESGEICNDLIKDGAKLTTDTKDILDYFGVENENFIAVEIDKQELRVLELLKDQEISVEKLAEKLNAEIGEIITTLTILELKNLAVRSAGNTYCYSGNKYCLAKNVEE